MLQVSPEVDVIYDKKRIAVQIPCWNADVHDFAAYPFVLPIKLLPGVS
jgi:hypothetical protein